MTISPATLEFASDGHTLFSSRFDDVYHSAHGAQRQAEAVFIAGNQLPARWQHKSCFSIIETGFGQGISFLSTWQAWRNDPSRSERLHFISVEQYPFTRDDLAQLHLQHPQFAELSAQLLTHWPHLTPGFHRIWLDQGQVSLTLLFGDAQQMLHEVSGKVDAIYLDGFSPSKNPEMWSLPVFKALWRLCKIDTTLATYTVAGHVRRGLTEAGFNVKKIQGFANKRQMLVGQCARLPKPARISDPTPPAITNKSAIIIGAGIAGCATAASLAERGWQVRIFDAAAGIAQQASGNHLGLCHPTFSKDDNALAQLSRAGFALTRQKLVHLAQQQPTADFFGFSGQFQVAKDEAQAVLMQDTTNSLNFPANLVQYLSIEQAADKIGSLPRHGGWWFEDGIWLNPRSLCHAYINEANTTISLELNTHVAYIKQQDQKWYLYDANHQLFADSETLILANATAATALLPAHDLPLSQSWRAVTQVPAANFPATLPSCSGAAYLTAAWQGWRSLGAAACTPDDASAATQNNLQALVEILPQLTPPATSATYTRICARPNSLDRLPLIGAIHQPLDQQGDHRSVHQLFQMPRLHGLYAVLGLGSRGISWHALAAEVIACELNAEPQPISRQLLNAIDPARFALRTARKSQVPR
jgi:tRNA 5-methylaminomethyl-2-thiouridine biosynthesis bifunctional protein